MHVHLIANELQQIASILMQISHYLFQFETASLVKNAYFNVFFLFLYVFIALDRSAKLFNSDYLPSLIFPCLLPLPAVLLQCSNFPSFQINKISSYTLYWCSRPAHASARVHRRRDRLPRRPRLIRKHRLNRTAR